MLSRLRFPLDIIKQVSQGAEKKIPRNPRYVQLLRRRRACVVTKLVEFYKYPTSGVQV